MNENEEWMDILKYKKHENITPDRYFDIWREHYEELSLPDHIEIAEMLFDKFIVFPYKNKNRSLSTWGTMPSGNPNYENKNCCRFFDFVCSQRDNINVLEFGGGLGNMARFLLNKHNKKIKRWDNYEILMQAITKNQCNYPQYTSIIPSKFFWELDFRPDYDVFLASHSIEHVIEKQAYEIFDKIKNIDSLYIECPIFPDSSGFTKENNVNTFFGGNCGTTHILDIGFEQITNYLKKYEYKLIEELSKPHIINVDGNRKRMRVKETNWEVIETVIPDGKVLHMPGRGYLRCDDGRNRGESRVYIKKTSSP